MKQKNLFFGYVGILAGTVITNICLNDQTFFLQDFTVQGDIDLLTLMIRRSIQIIILLYVGMIINRKVWSTAIDLLSGTVLGVLISIKTMSDSLFSTILYFLIALMIVSLYNIVLKLAMIESQSKEESLHMKLHNSFLNKLIVFAIIFINAVLEIIVMKIF